MMLQLLLAVGVLGWMTLAQNGPISPDSILQSLPFGPAKNSQNSGIYNNHPRTNDFQHGGRPTGGYQPSVGGSRFGQQDRPHNQGSYLANRPSDPFGKSGNSEHDPFAPDGGYPTGSQGRPHETPVHDSSSPFTLDNGVRHAPRNRQLFKPRESLFRSGNIHNNVYPHNNGQPPHRRLVHPLQRNSQRNKAFGIFNNDLLGDKSQKRSSLDLLSPIGGLRPSGGSIHNAPHQRRNPYASQPQQPGAGGDQYGSGSNQQYPPRNNYDRQSGSVPGGQQPPHYPHNDPNPSPTYTSNQYPTDNNDNSRPNPPQPSIPKFGQALAPPSPYIPPHKDNRNNGPTPNDQGYRGPGNDPSSSGPYQQNQNPTKYPGDDAGHGQQKPTYVSNQDQQYPDGNPHRQDQGQQYNDPNPHQDSGYAGSDPHQGQQYGNKNQDSNPQGSQYPAVHPAGGQQYPGTAADINQAHPKQQGYPGSDVNQYPPPQPHGGNQYPGTSNQGPQYPKQLPHNDQQYPGTNPNPGQGYSKDDQQPYQGTDGSKDPHQSSTEQSYPPGTHDQAPQKSGYEQNQGVEPVHPGPHSDSGYPEIEPKSTNQYDNQQPQKPNGYQQATVQPQDPYNAPKTSPDKDNAYPPQYASDSKPLPPHNNDPYSNSGYNGEPKNDQTNKYLKSDNREPPTSYPTKATYPSGVEHQASYPDTGTGKPGYPGSYPDKPKDATVEHPASYPDKDHGAAEQYPDKSANQGSGGLDYPGSYTDNAGPAPDVHGTSYPDKPQPHGAADHPVQYPENSVNPHSSNQDYSGSYPDKTGPAPATSYPDIPQPHGVADHPGEYPKKSVNPHSSTQDYPGSYSDKAGPDSGVQTSSYPSKHSAAEKPEAYSEKSNPTPSTDYADSGTSYQDKTEPPTAYPDNVHSQKYPEKSLHPNPTDNSGSYPVKPHNVEQPTSYSDKGTQYSASERPGSYSPKSSNSGTGNTDYADSYSSKANPSLALSSYLDKKVHPGNTGSSNSYPPKQPEQPNSYPTHLDPAIPVHQNPHSNKGTQPGANEYPGSYPDTPTHSGSYPQETGKSDSYPPKSTNPGASVHGDSYPASGYRSSQDGIANNVQPKPPIDPHKIHSKFPRNRYPGAVGIAPVYPPVAPKPAPQTPLSDANQYPGHQDDENKTPVHATTKPTTQFIPPGLRGQCFQYKDLSAGYKLSPNTFGYPEDEITEEIRQRPFLGPLLGFKTLGVAQQTNQFDINQLGLGGYNRRPQTGNNHLYAKKDYPTGYHEGDFNIATPRDYTCRVTSVPLRMFKLYGGKCWAVNPDFKKVTLKKCSAPGDYCGGGGSASKKRCSEDYDWVEVWSFCEKAPRGERTKPRKLYLPVGCSCKSYYC